MVHIESVTAVPVVGGYFFDDQRAIKRGAVRDGFSYSGAPETDGFERIRQPSEALSVLIELSDGRVAKGDCAAVQYSGAGGRDPVFRANEYVNVVENEVAPLINGCEAHAFMENVEQVDNYRNSFHSAIQYGISQALLAAAGLVTNETMTDVLASTYNIEPATDPVPIYAQSGDDRRENAEKMILKNVDVLPHGLFNNIDKVGQSGENLVEYIEWLAGRVAELGAETYEPTFHVDVYGLLGEIFGPPYDRGEVIDYIGELEQAAHRHPLQIEGPMDEGNREEQINAMAELRDGIAEHGVGVDIVADEWCNTLDDIKTFVDQGAADIVQVKTPDLGGIHRSAEAVLYCEETDVGAYLGGSCAETEISARASAHIALATKPIQVLAKPGMGVDEGITIVYNEMLRTIALRNADR